MNTVNMVKKEVENRMSEMDKKQAVAEKLIKKATGRTEDSHITYIENEIGIDETEILYNSTKTNKEFKWDCGAPKSVAGIKWTEDYLKAIGENIEDKEKIKTKDRFRFGNTPYNSLGRIKIPVYLKDKEGKIKEKEVTVYMIEKNIELLVGNSTKDLWKVVTADYENTYYLDKELDRPFRGRRTKGGHIAVALWIRR